MTRSWLDPVGGFFSDASNWSGSTVPGASDIAAFDLGSNYTVAFVTNPSNDRLLIEDDSVTLNLTGHTYSLTSTGSASLVVGIGARFNAGTGVLRVLGGSLSAVDALIGDSGLLGTAGTIQVLTGGLLTAQIMLVGAGRPGTFIVQSGGDAVTSFSAVVGDSSTGHATVTGSGSTWTLGSGASLDVGSGASGQLEVTSGGVVSGNGPASLGIPSGITGTANVSGSGSKWAMRDLVVGGQGAGVLSISGGGSVDVTGGSTFGTSIGDQIGGSGAVSVDGSGSRFRTGAGMQLKVGNFGTGQLQVTNRATVISGGNSFIGYSGFATGTVSLSGASSTWSTNGLYVGGGTSTAGGSGLLSIGPGTSLQNSTNTTVKIWSTGTVSLNGGTIQTGSLQVASGGHFDWSSGTLWITNAPIAVGTGGMLGNNLAIGAGKQLWGGQLNVGQAGAGSISVSGGGGVSMAEAFIGNTSAGYASVSGGGSDWSSYHLTVGAAASGSLNITAGGHVTSAGVFDAPTAIGDQPAVVGNVLVDGAGSVWDNVGDAAFPGYLFIGRSGTGILTVSNAASFNNTFTYGAIGSGTGSYGNVTLTSGGQMSLGYDLYVGEYGTASLTINNGADLSNGGTDIAYQPGSTGTASIADPGSTWNMSGIFVIGNGGAGLLNVTNGGSVTASESYIGQSPGSTGNVSVSGGGSSFVNNGSFGYLIVGGASNGSLNVQGGGSASAKETFVGDGATGVGSVTVSGAGSSFTNSAAIAVGYFGHGTMLISGGATVTNPEGYVASQMGSVGNVLVQGAGSAWNNTDTLDIAPGGSGSLTVQAGGAVNVTHTLKVWPGGRVDYLGGSVNTSTLDMSGGGLFVLGPGADKVLRVKVLAIDSAGGSRLDLADNALIVDYDGPSPASSIRNLLIAGRNGGAWTGNGVTSSSAAATPSTRALGYADNAALGLTSFSGQSVDSTCVLVKYTYPGDANLDGQVDISDLGVLATRWQTSGFWTNGDFDYNGFVDISDLGLLASNWQVGVELSGSRHSLTDALASWGLPLNSVPEPGGIMTLVFSCLAACASRRRVAGRPAEPAGANPALNAALIIGIAACSCFIPRQARAVDKHWNTGSASWGLSNSWSPAGVPTSSDIVYVDYLVGGTRGRANVSGSGFASPVSVHVTNLNEVNLVGLGVDSGQLSVGGDFIVGYGASTGFVNVNSSSPGIVFYNGRLTVGAAMRLGFASSSLGIVNQNDGIVTVNQLLRVGDRHSNSPILPGVGRYSLSGVGQLDAARLEIGYGGDSSQFGVDGTFNLSGNATLNVSLGAQVPDPMIGGNGGTGVFNQSGGTFYSPFRIISIGSGSSGSGVFNYSGGVFNVPGINLATNGTFNYLSGPDVTLGQISTTDGHIVLSPGHDKTARSRLLWTSAGSWSIDASDNSMVIGTTLGETVASALLRGYNGAAWNGNGINSSAARDDPQHKTTLGYGLASEVLIPSGGVYEFHGQTVSATSWIVQYTYYGDANLDGQVDIADLGRLATNWQTSGAWSSGDFNYDGFVDISDLGLLAGNWQQGVAAQIGRSSPSFDDALAQLGVLSTTIPEPAGLAVPILTSILSGRRVVRAPRRGSRVTSRRDRLSANVQGERTPSAVASPN